VVDVSKDGIGKEHDFIPCDVELEIAEHFHGPRNHKNEGHNKRAGFGRPNHAKEAKECEDRDNDFKTKDHVMEKQMRPIGWLETIILGIPTIGAEFKVASCPHGQTNRFTNF